MDWLKSWQKSAYDAGLIGCDYPVEHGGGGKDNCQAIANQEMQRAKTPYLPNIIGMGMAAPPFFSTLRRRSKQNYCPAYSLVKIFGAKGSLNRVPAQTWRISRPLLKRMATTG